MTTHVLFPFPSFLSLLIILPMAKGDGMVEKFFPANVGPGCVFIGGSTFIKLSPLIKDVAEETPLMVGLLDSNHSLSSQLMMESSASAWSVYKRCSHLIMMAQDENELIGSFDMDKLDSFVQSKYVFVLEKEEVDVQKMAGMMTGEHFELLRNVLLVTRGSRSDQQLVWGRDAIFGAGDLAILHVLNNNKKNKKSNEKSTMFPSLPMDLRGMRLSAATFPLPPFASPDPQGQYRGFEVQVFDSVASKLNFIYDITTVNGTWNVLVDHLARKRSELGFAHFFLTEERKRLIDFSDTFDTDYYCFLARKPASSPSWSALVQPFTLAVWAMIVVTVFCSLAVMEALANFGHYGLTSSMCLTFVLGAFVEEAQAEFMVRLRRPWLKLSVLLFLLGVFVLTSGYRGSLVSFLTAPVTPQPLDTLQQVVDSPLKVASIGNVIKANLHRSPEPLFQLFDAKYSLYSDLGIASMDDAFERAHQGEIVMYENRQMLQYRVAKDYTKRFGQTKFHLGSECSKPFNICFGLAKNSLLTPIINEVLAALKEGGLVSKYFKDVTENLSSDNTKLKGSGGDETTLTMQHLQGVFVLLAGGAFFALLTFGLEHVFGRFKKDRKCL